MKQTVYIAALSMQIPVWNLNHEGALTLTQVVDVPGQSAADGGQPGQTLSLCWCCPEFRVWRIVSPRTMAR